MSRRIRPLPNLRSSFRSGADEVRQQACANREQAKMGTREERPERAASRRSAEQRMGRRGCDAAPAQGRE